VTIHAEQVVAAAPSARLDEVADLAAQLHAALVRCVERDQPGPADPSAAALDRLLRQVANPADEALFQMPAAGGRVVVALLSGARSAAQLIRAVDVGTNVVVVAFAADEVVAFVPELPRRIGHDGGRARANIVASELIRHDPDAVVGISSTVTAVHQLPAARKECIHAAQLGARIGERIFAADAHWVATTLSQLSTAIPQCLTIDNPLSRLVAYDAANRTPFAETVHAWLQRKGDTSATAAALSVHPNTLRYRLRRASQLSGLDLDDAGTCAIALLVLGAVVASSSSAPPLVR
jgi:sugar diacid utilization regulator